MVTDGLGDGEAAVPGTIVDRGGCRLRRNFSSPAGFLGVTGEATTGRLVAPPPAGAFGAVNVGLVTGPVVGRNVADMGRFVAMPPGAFVARKVGVAFFVATKEGAAFFVAIKDGENVPTGLLVGMRDGDMVAPGDMTGLLVAISDALGDVMGRFVGPMVGEILGDTVGMPVGLAVGLMVGPIVGLTVGPIVGCFVGVTEGGCGRTDTTGIGTGTGTG